MTSGRAAEGLLHPGGGVPDAPVMVGCENIISTKGTPCNVPDAPVMVGCENPIARALDSALVPDAPVIVGCEEK